MLRFFIPLLLLTACNAPSKIMHEQQGSRVRISLDDDWKFFKYTGPSDSLLYDERPAEETFVDSKDADSKPTEAAQLAQGRQVLKAYILPTGNPFVKDASRRYIRPSGDPGSSFPFVQHDFDDSKWQKVDIPHDWGIAGPFQEGENAEVGGGMARLPSHGVAWYRKQLHFTELDRGKSVFLDIDGAMSYSMVWINNHLVGGWPYGYNSYQLDLTPYILYNAPNQLAIRIDNPPKSARWYPGGGLYRNVWLTKTNKVHVSHWGASVIAQNVSSQSADLDLSLSISNDDAQAHQVAVISEVYKTKNTGGSGARPDGVFPQKTITINAGEQLKLDFHTHLLQPALWGPPPTQHPDMYVLKTKIYENGHLVDNYETSFGIRDIRYDADRGIIVNGEPIKIRGVNQHHDLGALGTAFNVRAAERQLQILKELGCNAIRMSHNPPAPELLDLTDKMGFLVIDEIFDVWERKKTPYDFHLVFPEWHEQDLRAFIRRDRNHPSVIIWSYGNEVGEQYTDTAGAQLSLRLSGIVHEEDPTRPTMTAMNYAKPPMPFAGIPDVIALNYQGEGIRNAPAYKHLKGINTEPLYPSFRKNFPQKLIISSETASAFSTRGTFLFPVSDGVSAPAEDGKGGDPAAMEVSAYELYTAPFGASADKVFASQDKHPYVGGEWVWSGWDYLGEPTPYYNARSAYCGIIDLAGFPKERYYLYQSRWRPDLPMAHILPHWNWPDRIGQVTPVHVFTSGDAVELFLNGTSLGRKEKGQYEYRLRWDDVVYTPGALKAVAYKNGKPWAVDSVETTEKPFRIVLTADRSTINAGGADLAFITAKIVDSKGRMVPDARNRLQFDVNSNGKIVATDNGNPADMVAFPSPVRNAFNGLALCIVKASGHNSGTIILKASSPGLQPEALKIKVE